MQWTDTYVGIRRRFRDKLDFDFKYKARIKCKKLTLILPAGEAKAVPPITPISGQAGVNAGQSCLFFNKATTDSNEEPFFPPNTEISILGSNRFDLRIKNPSTSLISNLYKEFYLFEAEDEFFTIPTPYKIHSIKNEYKYVNSKSSFSTFRTFRQRPKKWIFVRMRREVKFRRIISDRNKRKVMHMWRILNLKRGLHRNGQGGVKSR
jgi:hypothetical protein